MNDFHDLFIMYAKDIYRFALLLSGDEMEAEEITAETFARIITGKTPIIRETVKGYLLTIARNLYLEMLRRQKRLVEIEPEIPIHAPNMEESMEFKIDLEDVHAYLQTFPEIDRAALLLRAGGMSYHEIAGSLEISVPAAKVKVHRLRLKLAEWRMNREEKKNSKGE